MSAFALDLATIRRAPKVLLHEHLDGGLRPATLIEMADEIGYAALPTRDPAELATWFKPAPGEGGLSLERYL
jgi:adenosine deaminase